MKYKCRPFRIWSRFYLTIFECYSYFWFTVRYCARRSSFEVIARLSDLSHEYFPVGIFCDHLFILLLLGICKIMDFTAVINRPVV